jgi:hypothetical protein
MGRRIRWSPQSQACPDNFFLLASASQFFLLITAQSTVEVDKDENCWGYFFDVVSMASSPVTVVCVGMAGKEDISRRA